MKKIFLSLLLAVCTVCTVFSVSFIGTEAEALAVVSVKAEESPEDAQGGEVVEEQTPPVTEENTPFEPDTDTETDGTDEITPPEDITNAGTESEIVAAFIAWLKDEYGDEYMTYYNAIIEQWGSVKAFLDSKIEDGTFSDESAEHWSAFVAWLHEYSVIWVPIVAGIVMLAVFFASRYAFKAVKRLFNRMFAGTNQTAAANLAIIDALEKLLGNSEKTKTERENLEKAKKELLKDE